MLRLFFAWEPFPLLQDLKMAHSSLGKDMFDYKHNLSISEVWGKDSLVKNSFNTHILTHIVGRKLVSGVWEKIYPEK